MRVCTSPIHRFRLLISSILKKRGKDSNIFLYHLYAAAYVNCKDFFDAPLEIFVIVINRLTHTCWPVAHQSNRPEQYSW